MSQAAVKASDIAIEVSGLSKSFNGREARLQKRFPVAAPVTVVPLGARCG